MSVHQADSNLHTSTHTLVRSYLNIQQHTYADISALFMHVPMFPRAMHCLKVESVSPPWGGGEVLRQILYLLHQLSSLLAQPPFSKICITLCFSSKFQFLSRIYQHNVNSFISVHNCPARPLTQTPQVFTSSPVLRRACSTVCHFLLWTLQTIANSSYSLPRLRAFLCCSVSTLMCEILPPVFHH